MMRRLSGMNMAGSSALGNPVESGANEKRHR